MQMNRETPQFEDFSNRCCICSHDLGSRFAICEVRSSWPPETRVEVNLHYECLGGALHPKHHLHFLYTLIDY